jgi:formamidopyrimidine-DNA glycosylase
MPELPEVETLCRQLNTFLPGEEILSIEILDPLLNRVEGLVGQRIEAVYRRGKGIRIALGNGLALALHLRMTGRLLWQSNDASLCPRTTRRMIQPTTQSATTPSLPYTRLVIFLTTGRLTLIDPRRFATFGALSSESHLPPLANPLEAFPARHLKEIAGSRRLPVKSFLMDQRFIAGIGNIYACEILHSSGVDPRRPAGQLSAAEWKKVEKAGMMILRRAVDCRGTTVSDWRDLFGTGGENQNHLTVYLREGKPCCSCSGTIEHIKIGGRGTWFCPKCQK